jgi:histidine ammonia-lyase
MSTAAARKCRNIITNTTRILACEILCAAQGIEFHRPTRAGRGAEAAYLHIREHVKALRRDRTLHRDLETCERLIQNDTLLDAVERTCDKLV